MARVMWVMAVIGLMAGTMDLSTDKPPEGVRQC